MDEEMKWIAMAVIGIALSMGLYYSVHAITTAQVLVAQAKYQECAKEKEDGN